MRARCRLLVEGALALLDDLGEGGGRVACDLQSALVGLGQPATAREAAALAGSLLGVPRDMPPTPWDHPPGE